MDNTAPKPLVSWGLVLTVVLLVGMEVLVLRLAPAWQAPWPHVAAIVSAATAAFLTGRWLLNYFWGLVLALLLTFHPLLLDAPDQPGPVARAALQLGTLALVTAAWQLVFAGRLRWRSWLILLPGLWLACTLAWLAAPPAGLTASVCGGLGLVLGGVLALARRRRPGSVGTPSAWNAAVAALGGVIVPAASLVAAPAMASVPTWLAHHGLPLPASIGNGLEERQAQDLLQTALAGSAAAFSLPGFAPEQLPAWCWPSPWVVLPLAAWGLWRGLRRGRLQWQDRRAPLGWLVPLYAVVDLCGMALDPAGVRAALFLPLAALGVFLAVFCMGDLTRGVAERMMLQPPGSEEASGKH
jgi:hypothetical protein